VDKPAFSAGAEGGHVLEGMGLPEPSTANPLPMLWAEILALRMQRPRVIGPLLRL
jgi:hypothetical protein